jgi:hypothetical protein
MKGCGVKQLGSGWQLRCGVGPPDRGRRAEDPGNLCVPETRLRFTSEVDLERAWVGGVRSDRYVNASGVRNLTGRRRQRLRA